MDPRRYQQAAINKRPGCSGAEVGFLMVVEVFGVGDQGPRHVPHPGRRIPGLKKAGEEVKTTTVIGNLKGLQRPARVWGWSALALTMVGSSVRCFQRST